MEAANIANHGPWMRIGIGVLLAVLTACSNSSNNQPRVQKPQADNPTVEGPITGGGGDDCCVVNVSGFPVDLRIDGLDYEPATPFYTFLNFDMAEVGYVEAEYFISGTATSYIATDDLGSDGIWSIEPADAAEYKTRIVVLRPINADDFNGTVVVEWFNVTGGLDAGPDLLQMHTELTRGGYVYVGVSAQSVGIEGGGAFSLPLKVVDPRRYGSLNHPGDSFAYDIFSQAAQAVRNPMGIDPLEGLQVERMIAVGQSQSASRLATYVNAVHPTVELIDAFVIHGRGSRSASLSQDPQVSVPTPDTVFIRDDLAEPIITLQAETDVPNSLRARQADSENYRLWEVAGTSHTDLYTTLTGTNDRGDDPAFADIKEQKEARPPFIFCAIPVNDGQIHYVANAAIAALDHWIRTGEAASFAPRMELSEDGTEFVLDSFGNAQGGVRTPSLEAPVAVLRGGGQPPADPFCGLLGTTELFDDAQLAVLYPDKQAYIDAMDRTSDEAVAAGFLLLADAELIKTRARTSDVAGPPTQ
ncbi:MAG: alpha/beta hydrolase domain-containing protein [Halioglobus sp.]|nr:alpha/beta hydrolase domain-containing protein [Halioglobus sp.]